jgi:hypothetical protein
VPYVLFQLTVTESNDLYYRYAGLSKDSALPYGFWQTSGYVIGLIRPAPGDQVTAGPVNVAEGRRFIVFGTSTETTYYMDLKAKIVGQVNTIETPPIRVNRSQYGYVIYDVQADGTLQMVGYGNVNPGQIPSISPPPTPSVALTLDVRTGGTVRLTVGTTTTTYSPGVHTLDYPQGTYIQLEATPASGYMFEGWYRGGTLITASRTYNFNLTTNTNLTARFTAVTPPPPGVYTLTLNIGTGGKLLVNNVEYRGSHQLTFPSGATVTLKAVPDNGYIISSFTVDGSAVSGSTTTITMNTNRQVNVSFITQQQTPTNQGGLSEMDRVIEDFMNRIMPPMMNIMMMMAMIQMMVELMQGLTAGVV